MPDIQQQFVDPYAAADLTAIAIDPDSQDYEDIAAVAGFVANQGVEYPVAVQDPAYPTYSTIEGVYDGANPYPVDVLVDKAGIIRYVAREYDPVTMGAVIEELLAE